MAWASIIPAVTLAVCFGSGSVVQSGVNSSLGRQLGHTVPASLVSFCGGFVFLLLLYICLWFWLQLRRDGRSIWRGTALEQGQRPWCGCRMKDLRWWELTGGCLGCSSMVLSLLALPALGFALTNLMQISGQLGASLLLDHRGCLGMPRRQVSWDRLAGVTIVGLGCALSTLSAQSSLVGPADSDSYELNFWISVCMAAAAGAAPALQSCVNRHVSTRLPVRGVGGALVSFSVGVFSLSLACVALYGLGVSIGGPPMLSSPLPPLREIVLTSPHPHWWMLTGGLFGACNVTGNIVLSPLISVTGVAVSNLLGRMSVAIFLDVIGAFGFIVQPVGLQRALGIILVLIGVGFTTFKQFQQQRMAAGDHMSRNYAPLSSRDDESTELSLHCEMQLLAEPSGISKNAKDTIST